MKIIPEILNSRSSIWLSLLILAAGIFVELNLGKVSYLTGDRSTAFPAAEDWVLNPLAQAAISFGLYASVIIVMAAINKVYNLLRASTHIYALIFALGVVSVPDLAAQLYTGPVLCLTVSLCIFIMLSCYASPMSTRRVFLVFFLLSGLSTTQYAYLSYLPAFLIGIAQMRILSWRTILAALTGLLTPWWILLGFGILKIDDFHLPHFESIFRGFDLTQLVGLLISASVVLLVAILSYASNFLRTLAYNAQARAKNGMITVVTVFTVLAMVIDFTNFTSYLPTLCFCSALQASQLYVNHLQSKGWIGFLVLAGIYLGLFVWNLGLITP